MIEKTMKSRHVQKHATEADWNRALLFIPKQAEIVVYDIDENYNYERFKIGDGVTLLADLPFSVDSAVNEILKKYEFVDNQARDDISTLKAAPKIIPLTQSEYDALPVKDETTIYIIKE